MALDVAQTGPRLPSQSVTSLPENSAFYLIILKHYVPMLVRDRPASKTELHQKIAPKSEGSSAVAAANQLVTPAQASPNYSAFPQ